MIRKINLKDKEEFLKMCSKFYTSEAVLHKIPEKHMETTFSESLKESSLCPCYIIEENEKPIGYMLLALTFSNEAGGLAVWVEELFIKEAFRKKGFGKEALSFLKREFPQAKRFRLEITPSNKNAEKLYKAYGFSNLSYLQMIMDI